MPGEKKPLYEHDEVAILRFDRDGNIVSSNGNAREIFGYGEKEFLRLRIQDIDPLIPEGSWSKYIEEVPPGGALKFTRRLRAKDGTDFPALVISHRPASGDGTAIVGFIHDITADVRTEEALRESERLLKRSQEAACLGSYKLDLASGEWTCSTVLDDLFGIGDGHKKDVDGWAVLISPDQRDEMLSAHERTVIAHDTRFDKEYRIIRPSDGEERWVHDVGEIEYDDRGKPVRMIGIIRDITERRRAVEALRESDRFLRKSQEVGRIGSFWLAIPSMEWGISDVLADIVGIGDRFPMDAGSWKKIVLPDDWGEFQSGWERRLAGETFRFEREYRIIRPSNGEVRWLRSIGEPEFDERGTMIRVVGTTQDVTERKRAEEKREALEEQLRQAHKMESVGRLAGGVAHDFNNMLTVILGYTEILKGRIAADDPLQQFLAEIEKAAGHSRDVTGQLLAFSRKQIIAPRAVNLNDLLVEIEKTILRLIGEDVRLVVLPGEGLWDVRFDPSQLNQILVNLALNARDAMPEGGRLTIVTRNGRFGEKEEFPDGSVRAPGDYVLLEVTDTGAGMDKETLSHVFEPFFTTKQVGQGTGLGLPTVYGIVRQNEACIGVRSEPGRGTAFRIFIPRLEADAFPTAAPGDVADGPEAEKSGTILLVEDEAGVRCVAARMLEEAGYTVVAAGTPDEAVSLLSDPDRPFDLLLTDVTMPGMNGRLLSRKAESARPGIGVLFMSGYSKELFMKSGLLEEGVHFLYKPFSRDALVRAVRGAIPPAGRRQ